MFRKKKMIGSNIFDPKTEMDSIFSHHGSSPNGDFDPLAYFKRGLDQFQPRFRRSAHEVTLGMALLLKTNRGWIRCPVSNTPAAEKL
uniref:Uncharacterized protein n=1 Tax=Brassica oleracea TaxID=3712 RepID=A0A3P6EDL6_BRAOL|nr:unnamed protein product [Brassica oleracea]